MEKIERLKSVIKEAGEILKEGYYAEKSVHFKSPIDLVTEYDVKIENFLIDKLHTIFPDFQIVGEESSENTRINDKAIIIDPIDGTSNFVHKIPFTAISVGIWEKNQPQIGIVYNPILNELFFAQKGEGAYLNGEKIAVSANDTLQKALIATGFPYTKIKKGEDYHWVLDTMKVLLPKTRDIRRLGSAAMDLCYVAKGAFDGFYEVNLKPWDVAAGILIVEEAGGKISRETGGQYHFSDRIILASNRRIHTQLAENIRSM